MNRLKIIGIVAAIHAALFLLIFAIPGCRSTGKTGSAESATVAASPAVASPIVTAPPPAVPNFDPNAPAAGPRVSPTRPGSVTAVALTPPPVVSSAPPPAASYTVKSGDSLYVIAKNNKITVRELAAANKIGVDAILRPGQKLNIPAAASAKPVASSATAAIPVADDSTTGYTVKSGDTLKGIAQRNRTTPEAIKALNNLTGDTVRANQVLRLPLAAPSAAALAPVASGGVTHIVKSGETLGDIAKKYNVKVGELAVANSIADPKKLRLGQELRIPSKPSPASPPIAPATPADVSPIRPEPPSSATTSVPMFNFTLPVATPDAPPAAAGASPISPAPPTASGPIIKIEGDGAPRIP